MAKYASQTKTTVEESQAEIARILKGNGATHTMLGSGPEGDLIGFQIGGRQFRFSVRRPDNDAARGTFLAQGGSEWGWTNQTNQATWLNREWMRRWRAAVLWVKGTVEFAGGDIEILRRVFLGSAVLPDGQTFSQWAQPQIDSMYDSGRMPPLLGSGS